MSSVTAFTIVMCIWTISDFVSKKTKSILSSLFVASVIFLIGFKSNLFPKDLLTNSSLLTLGQTVVGMILVHIGTMISLDELKKQWKTALIGFSAVIGITLSLFFIGRLFMDQNYLIGAIGAVSGGTISIIIVQEAAMEYGLIMVAAFPVLIAAFQGLIGFPMTSLILRKEAKRLKGEYEAGNIKVKKEDESTQKKTLLPPLPAPFQTTAGTLFVVGLCVMLAAFVDKATGGLLNTFIVALLLGIALRTLGLFKPNVLSGIDAFGLMMISILIIIYGPLASISINELIELIGPILIAFAVGVGGNILVSALVGKSVGYSVPMSIAIGLTSLYGFPGTMILSQEAARSVGSNEDEIKAIEGEILPKMIIAGFATVTITSVFITSILAELITK